MIDMANTRVLVGKPASSLDLGLRDVYSRVSTPTESRLGFAYASDSGLDTLLSQVGDLPNWTGSRKEWIVGLHHGITEPRALERIRSLHNSNLRLFVGGNRLSLSDLVIGRQFHAKVVLITSGAGRRRTPVFLLASSANLTGAALSREARNYEAGIAMFGSAVSRSDFLALERWWAEATSASIVATDDVLDQYARLRSTFLDRNPDALAGVDPPSLSQLRTSLTLWIEAGAMSGGSRNQVEFNRDLAGFFGPTTERTRYLRIRTTGAEWDDRPLAHKVTTYGVDIWRLSLPTHSAGGFSYPNTVIRFKRAVDAHGEYFEIDVAMPTEKKFGRWRSMAHRHGYVGLTSGQRSFGFSNGS